MTLSIKAGRTLAPWKNKIVALKRMVMASLILSFFQGSAFATDLLSTGTARDDVKATFGADSMIAMGIIIGEVIIGVATYIKTRNLLALVGLAVVIVFTTVGFGYIK